VEDPNLTTAAGTVTGYPAGVCRPALMHDNRSETSKKESNREKIRS